MKLCIVLQYFGGDYFRAMELARFIADLEPTERHDVRFLFVRRWDAAKPDIPKALVDKFDVASEVTSKYQWTGWPAGPNGIAREVLEAAPFWLQRNWGPMHGIEALLMLEPDCVPFARGWLDQLIAEWQRAENAWQVGAWRGSGGPEGHINGNCLIRPDIRGVLPLQVITQHLAWDCAIAPLMRNHWRTTKLIVNHFDSRNATKDAIPETAVLVHGYKDDSAMKLARHYLL
jgi:hypothetical protein